MIYGYVRVSTDRQDNDNQKFEINNFCRRQKLSIDEYVEETISGTKEPKKRKLGKLLDVVQSGDLIICGEVSRLGRSMFMVMDILKALLERNVRVWTIKDNYRLDESIQSKVLAFAFGLAAEIERNMISMRTKEALARKRAEGVRLGRPRGYKGTHKLTGKKGKIIEMAKNGYTRQDMAVELGVHVGTLRRATVAYGINLHNYTRRKIKQTPRANKLETRADTVKTLVECGMNRHQICSAMKVGLKALDFFLAKYKLKIKCKPGRPRGQSAVGFRGGRVDGC